ncbi:hypothetical protein CUN61_09360 [Pseudomonas arsenicoxydans]|uniref:Uncharacterized protein n=1 Tax=Pseudomonas arsenicoxydans TaxID=702115 RepID=A0A4P6G459_9PSED|nr:hypothetical protein CUN61_09360 [Pseudomonas arsenicoxydans]
MCCRAPSKNACRWDNWKVSPFEVQIVPTLCVGMPQWTLCVRSWDAERPGLHSHAERENDQLNSRDGALGVR